MNEVKDFIIDFMGVFYEAMPFIVLGSVISGVLEEMVPQQFISRFVPKNRVLAVAMGALLGLIFPMCECGIVPIMRRLLRKGVPLSSCIAYMLAGPIINVIVIASTWVAFNKHEGGYYIIALRVILGFLVAVGTALIVDRLHRKHGDELLTLMSRPKSAAKTVSLTIVAGEKVGGDEKEEPEPKKPAWQRIGNITETALHDFVDITVFLTLGAVMASISKMYITAPRVAELSSQYPALAILSMMGLAIVMCLCSEADAFVAASFTTMHPSAKLAFLVLGPMLDFKLYMMFTRVFRQRLIWTIIVSLIVQVFIYAMIVHYLWGVLDWPLPKSTI